MGKLLCRDGMLRLAANVRERPEQWLSRLIFLLGPWVSFWMVERSEERRVGKEC